MERKQPGRLTALVAFVTTTCLGAATVATFYEQQNPQTGMDNNDGLEPQGLSSPSQSEIKNETCPQGYEGRTLKKGEWPLIILREYGVPGTNDSPIEYTNDKGEIHKLENWREFKKFYPQQPGDLICVPKAESSFKNNGVIFQAAVRSKNNKLAEQSKNIQASIKAKVGF